MIESMDGRMAGLMFDIDNNGWIANMNGSLIEGMNDGWIETLNGD